MSRLLFILPFHLICLVANVHHWMRIPGAYNYLPYTKFLTMWGLFGHTIYFLLSSLDDLFHAYQQLTHASPKTRQRQNQHLDMFFRAFSFPLATIVAVLFWSIYFIDRELIYPKSFEAEVPPYLNHIQHTFPLISVLVDMALVDHSYHSANLRLDLSMIGAVSLAYVGLLFYIKSTDGTWVYPFIGLLSDVAKVVFFAFGMVLSWVFYYSGKVASGWLWQETKKAIKNA